MNVAGFVRTILARPLVIGLLIVVGLGFGAYGWTTAKPSYQSSGSAIVIPPRPADAATDAGQNPFINLGGGMPQLAYALGTAAQSPEAHERVEAVGGTGYTLSTLAGDSSSFSQLSAQITFTVTAPDAEAARRGATALVGYMRDKLRTIQTEAGVLPSTLATLQVGVAPTAAAEIAAGSARAAVSYGVGAMFLVIVLILVLVSARRLGGSRRPDDAAETEAESTESENAEAESAGSENAQAENAEAESAGSENAEPAGPRAPAPADSSDEAADESAGVRGKVPSRRWVRPGKTGDRVRQKR